MHIFGDVIVSEAKIELLEGCRINCLVRTDQKMDFLAGKQGCRRPHQVCILTWLVVKAAFSVLFVVASPNMNADDDVPLRPAPSKKCIDIFLYGRSRLKELPDRVGMLVKGRIITIGPAVQEDDFFFLGDLPERVFAHNAKLVPKNMSFGDSLPQRPSVHKSSVGPMLHGLIVFVFGDPPCRQRHKRRRVLAEHIPFCEPEMGRVFIKRRVENHTAMFFCESNTMPKQEQAISELPGFTGDD